MDNQLNLNGGNNQGMVMAMDSVILDISPCLKTGADVHYNGLPYKQIIQLRQQP